MAKGTVTVTGWLLHHDPNAPDVGGVRGLLGEPLLIQLSVMLHTIGALLIAGALVGILVAHRRRVQGAPDAMTGWTSRPRLLGLLGAGWGANLLGGTMRLLQPDHPSIAQFAEVAWVQVLTVKHVILLGAIAASLVAAGLVPAAWRRLQPQGAVLGIALVVLAAVLGGASTTLPIPGVTMTADGPQGPPAPGTHVTNYQNFSGQMIATPLSAATSEFPFRVDAWTFALVARVSWENTQSVIEGHLLDAQGGTAARLEAAGPAMLEARLDANLHPGGWFVVLESEQALAESVRVSIQTDEGSHGIRVFEDTVTVRERFFELNFWMDPGDWVRYNWSVPTAYGSVDWDIHSHPGGEVVYHHEATDRSEDGNFTAGGDRIYSILWLRDADVSALTLSYRVEGTFRLHSIYG